MNRLSAMALGAALAAMAATTACSPQPAADGDTSEAASTDRAKADPSRVRFVQFDRTESKI